MKDKTIIELLNRSVKRLEKAEKGLYKDVHIGEAGLAIQAVKTTLTEVMERLEGKEVIGLLEKVVKYATDGAETRMQALCLAIGTEDKNNFKHDKSYTRYTQCAIHAQSAIATIKGESHE